MLWFNWEICRYVQKKSHAAFIPGTITFATLGQFRENAPPPLFFKKYKKVPKKIKRGGKSIIRGRRKKNVQSSNDISIKLYQINVKTSTRTT